MTSPTEILSENSLGQKRISFFSDDKLLECWIESENPSLRIGEIHYARVCQVQKLINRITPLWIEKSNNPEQIIFWSYF